MDARDRDGDRLEPLLCRVYTHARRHPVVIGNIQGLRIPPVTPAQLAVGISSVALLVVGRGVWAHLGMAGNAVVLVGLPVTLAWLVRAARMEGRAPWRAGLGWLQLLMAPPAGVCLGRRDRLRRMSRCRGRVWVAELGTDGPPRRSAPNRTGARLDETLPALDGGGR